MKKGFVAAVAALLLLTGCSSSQTSSSGDNSTTVDTSQTTSFPPFLSKCDNGNRLYVIVYADGEIGGFSVVHDATC